MMKQFHIRLFHFPAFVLMLTALAACGGKKTRTTDPETSVMPDRYEEGGVLRIQEDRAPGLFDWISYHRRSDTAISLASMPASGVVIHMDPLDTMSSAPVLCPDTLLAWSPDRSRYIDLWSYNHIIDTTPEGRIRMIGGGPEQMVVIGERISGRRWSLMFNGTGQYAESADWLDPNTFVIGMMLVNESSGERTPEIMLFSLADSTFTDFRYVRAIPSDSLPPTPGGYAPYRFTQRGIQTRYP
jgi:hypothetical protein